MLVSGGGGGEDSPALEGSPEAVGTGEASVRFRSPEDGATVDNPVRVQMEAEGVTIEPASSGVNANAGHFHVLVDVDCFPEGEVIPNDQSHHHYGMGQTEAQLTLAPGEHQLCLQVGDGNHAALPLTDTVEITVR
ncbi:MAG TPA: DUF4399 domain-containing protein [Actinomycetota bacterium]|nr:DUF4399 domain-containing protein [Actinomycetota bacterium]